MKLASTIFLVFAIIIGQAQNIEIDIQRQTTIGGVEYGANVLIGKGKVALGYSIQNGLKTATEYTDTNHRFQGMIVKLPIRTCEKLSLFFTPRIGFVAEQFFVVLPELKLYLPLIGNIDLNLGSGIRYGQPSVSLGLSYSPSKL
ncbi:MAG: hypothetical protein RIC03_02865 [Cyclobacteriaceae bacterium]